MNKRIEALYQSHADAAADESVDIVLERHLKEAFAKLEVKFDRERREKARSKAREAALKHYDETHPNPPRSDTVTVLKD